MGLLQSKSKKRKPGAPYKMLRPRLRPFDLVLFRGGEAVSDMIRCFQRNQHDEDDGAKAAKAGEWSHVGMIVTSEVLDHPRMKPGHLYILESTATGVLGCGVKNIDGESAFCVQITDLDALVKAYDASRETALAVARMSPKFLVPGSYAEYKPHMQRAWKRLGGCSYDFNAVSLFAAIFPGMRQYRDAAEYIMESRDWYFCSELVCEVYKELGLLSNDVDSRDVVPEDFLPGLDADRAIPSDLFPLDLVQRFTTRPTRKRMTNYYVVL